MNNEAVTSEQTVVLQQQVADPSPILPIFGGSEVFPANYEEQVVPDRHFQVNDVINVSVEDDFRIESSQPNAFETCLDTLQRHGEKLDVSEPVSSRDVEPINEPNIEPNVPSSFILASPVRSAQDWIRYPAGYASSNTVKRSRAGRDLDTPRKVTASVQPTPASKSALQLFLEREDDNFSRMCCERDAVNPSCVATSGSWNDSTVRQEACVVPADRPPPHLDVATRLSLPLLNRMKTHDLPLPQGQARSRHQAENCTSKLWSAFSQLQSRKTPNVRLSDVRRSTTSHHHPSVAAPYNSTSNAVGPRNSNSVVRKENVVAPTLLSYPPPLDASTPYTVSSWQRSQSLPPWTTPRDNNAVPLTFHPSTIQKRPGAEKPITILYLNRYHMYI